jgi:hypothetical protein
MHALTRKWTVQALQFVIAVDASLISVFSSCPASFFCLESSSLPSSFVFVDKVS